MFWINIAPTLADVATNISVTPGPVPLDSDQKSSMGWIGSVSQQGSARSRCPAEPTQLCGQRCVPVAVDHKDIHAALKTLESLQVLLPCSHLTPFPV